MKMETLEEVMDRLTFLKNCGEHTPFGFSSDENEIRSIDSLLRIFGVKWHYTLDDNDRWIAVINPT